MTRHLINSGSTFEDEIGCSRAVVDDERVFVAGTTGFDYARMTIASGLLEQTEQCLKNIESALRQAGSSMADIFCVNLRESGRISRVLARAGKVLRRAK
ncbi:MAG: Rid family hydrolase [Burkholderiales bacterium]